MSKDPARAKVSGFDLPTPIIFVMTLLVPVAVLPNTLDNAFNTPKSLIIIAGVSLLLLVYFAEFFRGKAVRKSDTSSPMWVVILIFLNLLSFIYTENYYFTKIAALMNISCLLFFFFVSLHIDEKKAFWILVVIAFSGVLVSTSTYLQFADKSVLFKWAAAEGAIMGTIGNSNYLGAYLLFPLFALSGLMFLSKGKWRFISAGFLIFVFGAFLCSRARASWLGSISLALLFLQVRRIHNFSVRSYIKKRPRYVFGYGILILSLIVVLWSIAPQRFHSTMDIKRWTEIRTLKLRMKYFKASWWLFKQSPLFGTGLWSYRNLVYDAQAEINKKDPDFFKGYEEPKPRRVHNEYLEILNDGGLVAAGFLGIFFFVVVIRHGRRIIRDESIEKQVRIVTATAFSAMVGIMIAALFFFPFRVNSTMFMTALMMGLMEGIYIRIYGRLSKTEGRRLPFVYPAIFFITLVLAGVFWFGALRPLRSEMEHLKYKKTMSYGNGKLAQEHILKALYFDPGNSLYHVHAARLYMPFVPEKFRKRKWIKPEIDLAKARYHLDSAIINFNGDLTAWSVHFSEGLLKFRMGSISEARADFEKSIYYNPEFKPAREKLKEVQNLLEKHDRITIKIR